MQIATITWNPDHDETKVKFNKDFLASDWVVRADVLKDLYVFFEEAYTEVVQENHK